MYNYSILELTEDMTKILNRGLNFCVTPDSVNITELRAELRTFDRKMRWHEHWFDEDAIEPKPVWIPPIFRKNKSNLPTNSSARLMVFLNGVKSQIIGTPFNKVKSNITKGEIEAIKTLITLQKEQVIVIKPCNKGGGIIICDFVKYKESCQTHLKSKTETGEPYYKQIQPNSIKPMIKEIDKNLKSALTNYYTVPV